MMNEINQLKAELITHLSGDLKDPEKRNEKLYTVIIAALKAFLPKDDDTIPEEALEEMRNLKQELPYKTNISKKAGSLS